MLNDKKNHLGSHHSFDDTYQESKEMYGHPYKELQEYFKKYPLKGTVLDLGCGQGRDSIFLSSIGFKVTAVDNSKVGIQQMISKSKEMGLKINGIVSDIQTLKFDEKFDVILFDMVLHSFEKTEQVSLVKKYSENLEDNGIFCIVYPDDMDSNHFMGIFYSISVKWILKDKIIIHDVPKIPGEEGDYTFNMMVVQRK